jgi:hypothetical protein
MTRPVVYITQAGTHDYSPAAEYGALESLAHGELQFRSSGADREVQIQIREKLADYRPGHDYILLAGSPLTIAWVMLLISELEPMSGAPHKFLKWDSNARRYQVFEITTPITANLAA